MQRLRIALIIPLAAFFVALLVAPAAFSHSDPVSRGRLVFAYSDRPSIGVLDLDSGEVTHRFEMPAVNPRLILSDEGRYVFIVTGDPHGTVRILDTGLIYESHGDHVDFDKGEVKLLQFAITGARPSHITSANGWVTVFYDGRRGETSTPSPAVSAKAVAIEIASLVHQRPMTIKLDTPGPQHGLAVALGQRNFLITSPNPAYARFEENAGSLPLGVSVLGGDGKRRIAAFDGSVKNQPSCPQLHGHAGLGKAHVFGCAAAPDASGGGVLVLRRQGSKWTATSRAYPDARRVSTLRADRNARYAIGNYGEVGKYDALIRIDARSAGALERSDVYQIPGDQPVCQFAASGERAVNLTPDGRLRVYRVMPDWTEIASFDAINAFDCAFDAKEARPALGILGARAFISDPAGKRIREFDLKTLKQSLDLPLDGAPGNLATFD